MGLNLEKEVCGMRSIIFWLLGLFFLLTPGLSQTAGTENPEENPWYKRIKVELSVAGLFQSVVGVNKELANLHAHGGREPAGTRDLVLTDENKAYGAFTVDLNFTAKLSKNEKDYILLETGLGKNPESEIPSFSGIVDEALSMVPVEIRNGNVRISEAWCEGEWSLYGGKFRFRAGKIDMTTEVDQNPYANSENTEFISPVFVNNAAVEWASYSFGVVASYEARNWSLTLGYEGADPGWKSFLHYPFLIAQLAVSPELKRPGNYRFYVWYQGEKHLKWSDLENYFAWNIKPENEDPAWGFGVSFDQEVSEGIGIFFRYGWRGDDLVGYWNGKLENLDFSYGFSQSASFGISLWGQRGNKLGLGIAWFGISDNYKNYWEAEGVYARRLAMDTNMYQHKAQDEWHLEFYYHFKMGKHLDLTPDFQYTWNPAGLKDNGFLILNIRGVWKF